jgi:alanyl-tRNA synthetase
LRFDFSHFEALKPAQILEIEDLCNIQIRSALDVKNFEVPFNEKPKDCLAFFGEKYGDHVRVVQIGDISSELCGGTHVKNTGEIGFFKVVAESSIAAGTRRIEAVAGESAQALVATLWETTGELAGTLGCSREGVLARFHQLEDEKDVLRKSLQHTKQRLVEREYRELVARMHRSETLKWLVEECGDWDAETLRANAIRLCKEGQCDVVILGSVSSGKWTVVASCSQAAIAKGLQANTLLKNLLDKVGGKGGGKADSAMGGTANIEGFRTLLGDFRPF